MNTFRIRLYSRQRTSLVEGRFDIGDNFTPARWSEICSIESFERGSASSRTEI